MSGKNQKIERYISSRIIRNMILPEIFLTAFFLIFLINCPAVSQNIYGDEWINSKQNYLHIPVVQTGFYKITSQELTSAGFPIADNPAASLQMFRRGKEVAIEVKNELPDKLGANGYISFYGEKNDGALDSSLYIAPAVMPHSHYSLYSDTAAYFLTWKTDGGFGKRIAKLPATNTLKTLNYHFEETSELFNSSYFTGNFYPAGSNFDTGTVLSTYDTGEGWTGKELNNAWQIVDINTSNPDVDHFNNSEAELVFVGRSVGMHEIEIWTGIAGALKRKITTISLLNYNSITYKFSLNKEDVNPNGKIAVSIYAKEKTGSISVSYIKWRYPQKSILFASNLQKIFHFETNSESILWNIGKADSWQMYDCSDPYNLRELERSNSGIFLAGSSKIIGVKEPLKINNPRLINFKSFDTLQTDYLIITHPAVRKPINGIDPVEAYASYRASKEGGGYKTLIINSEEIYDQFNYGEPGPRGIRNMIARMFKQGQLKFVFIIGRSTNPQTARKLSNARETDMIPNAGWPGSDLALSMGIGDAPTYVPLVPIGRINALNSENVWTYLQKVKAMEAEPASASWRKNILHLSGGRSVEELSAFKSYVNSFEDKIKNSSLAAQVQTISKQTDAETEQFPIYIPVNKGIALMTLYGHSGLDVTDIDIGFASDEKRKYQNKPFYPAVIVNGCALGSIFYSTKTISTDWIFSPTNGAVLFLAHTFNGVSSALKHYSDSFYEVLADSQFVSEPFGTIQQEAIRRNMLLNPTLSNGIAAQQMNLHGDPAIRIFPARLPDYNFDSTVITFTDPSGKKLSTWSDSVLIQVGIKNNGRFRKENYQLLVNGNSESSKSFSEITTQTAPTYADTLYFKIPNPFTKAENYTWEIKIDPENQLPEETKSNNIFTKTFKLPEGGAFPILPLPDYVTNLREIDLIAQIPFERNETEIIFEWDTTSSFSSAQRSIETAKNSIASHKIFISGKQKQKIFWHVYLKEDQKRPSLSRTINYLPDTVFAVQLPEVVALNLKPDITKIQEGDIFRPNVIFQNITDIAFKDSLAVQITHGTLGKTDTIIHYIPPLQAKESRNLQMDFGTTMEVGQHQISIIFNANKLPEQLYFNNEVSLSFEVIADLTPPVLNVSVDQRQLVDGDFVSAQPLIGIQVRDENKFLIRKDTSGIEVWLKEDCISCQEHRLSLADSKINHLLPNDFQIWLRLSAFLKNGTYLLRVKARDVSGNEAPDYQIHFKIKVTTQIINAGVAPNPANQWFRFYAELEGSLPDEEPFVITINDLKGKEIEKICTVIHAGKNEWFWQPENLSAGLYFYRMETETGKFTFSNEVIKGLRGKLIWIR